MAETLRLSAQWALWTTGHRVTRCARGALTPSTFEDIPHEFPTSHHRRIPQAAVSWLYPGPKTRMVITIADGSVQLDGAPQGAATRHFAIAYADLTRPVSYEDLYVALAGRELRGTDPVVVDVPVLDPMRIADRVTGFAKATAALLLTGRQVCVTGAEELTFPERLRFLDTVAALLPYGARTKFSATTWADSVSDHRFRLAFSPHARANFHSLAWDGPVEPPSDPPAAREYFDLLDRAHDLPDLLSALADSLAPSSPYANPAEALRVARGAQRPDRRDPGFPPPQPPPPRPPQAPQPKYETLLAACAEALWREHHAALRRHLADLEALWESGGRPDHDQAHEIIKNGALLARRDDLPDDLREHLLRVVLRVGYGPRLTSKSLTRALKAARPKSSDLFARLLEMPYEDGSVQGKRIYELVEWLRGLDPYELVATAARQPVHPEIASMALDLIREGADRTPEPFRLALHAHHHLTGTVALLYPGAIGTQAEALRGLVVAAYPGAMLAEHTQRILNAVQGAPAMKRALASQPGQPPTGGGPPGQGGPGGARRRGRGNGSLRGFWKRDGGGA
ncbi:hypothetical protein EDD29_3804 [Actinocorallia herbida]|uniref:Uncharacterized protein n=1 Tax=Actinocorallia herbida TaxID=58109 RepID=A0A3N1CY86_9ACTN|nr:hypothetical protein [Actinocorallia herbida]ROO86241.1 hypothetical protein EDD29_3804 [Actinocorallia herbida]